MLGMERHVIGRHLRDRRHGAWQFAIAAACHCRGHRGIVRPIFRVVCGCVVASAASNPFRYFNSSPEIIGLAVLMYVKYPLSLRNVEDLLAERGIDISYETVRFWWNRFGPMFAAEIRKRRVAQMRGYPRWRWHLDEVFVKVNGLYPDPRA
jgi:hypothetical protein